MDVPLEDQIRCARRELAKREQHYPVWIRQGRMKSATAERETRLMRAICETLERLQREEAARQGELFASGG